ncbi:MAG: hypothetical protein ACREWI_10170 [Telluria sp.]
MLKDDLLYLKAIASGVAAQHFGVSKMFRVVYPEKHGSWPALR